MAKVGKQIGQGAYATVAFGLHKESSKKVAIKIYDARRHVTASVTSLDVARRCMSSWCWLGDELETKPLAFHFVTLVQEKYKLLDPQRRKSVRCEIRFLAVDLWTRGHLAGCLCHRRMCC